MLWLIPVIFLVGCATSSGPVRDPAGQVLSPGGLNAEEERACDGYTCKHFLAPCSLREHSPQLRVPNAMGPRRYTSLKSEAYARELESLINAGYCQMPTRTMPEELYNHDTCIFVFIKKPDC